MSILKVIATKVAKLKQERQARKAITKLEYICSDLSYLHNAKSVNPFIQHCLSVRRKNVGYYIMNYLNQHINLIELKQRISALEEAINMARTNGTSRIKTRTTTSTKSGKSHSKRRGDDV